MIKGYVYLGVRTSAEDLSELGDAGRWSHCGVQELEHSWLYIPQSRSFLYLSQFDLKTNKTD